ncbi:hypothetical protein D9757_000631 [Collybiopsis confluens]|uniref:Uncharacterized protein n=1 Tax=Collybiopsis confluens TaxID=2823264 RepID=A0A8H5I1S0_9AGAR|nr:hypothetical protein D9757_000631 [Collybiopsis confluens]
MAKNSKVSIATGSSKIITDYFLRRPATRPIHKKDSNKTQETESTDAISSSHLAAPPPTENRTRMRSRTPECGTRESSKPSPAKPSGKRKAKFGVEATPENTDPVLVVARLTNSVPLSTAAPPSPLSLSNDLTPSGSKNDLIKKFRLSSPALSEVPGSVFGEEEIGDLPPIIHDSQASRESVTKWRDQTSQLFNFPDDMDIDADENETAVARRDADGSVTSPERTTPSPFQQLTPPPTTVHQPLHLPTIVPSSDAVEKAKQLIADIRAKAIAEANSSPIQDSKPFELRESLSDSDSDDDLQPLEIMTKNKTTKKIKSPLVATTRYNTRSFDPQASSKDLQKSPSVQHDKRKSMVTKKTNPFLALLKEKREEEGAGRSTIDYIKAAETALSIEYMLLEMDDDEDETPGEPSMPQRSNENDTDDMKVVLDDGDRERLFGHQGDQIKDILDGDKENRKADEFQQSRIGVAFWSRDHIDDDAVTNDETPLDFGDYCQQPILAMLHSALQSTGKVCESQSKFAADISLDVKRSSAILNLGLLSAVNLQSHPAVVNHLSYLSLSSKYEELGLAAFRALMNVWTVSQAGRMHGISLQSILRAMSELGAKAELLNLPGGSHPNVDEKKRERLVFRLIKMIEVSARQRLLNPTELPEIVLVLLAVSLDSSTPSALQDEIMLVLHTVFQSIADPNVVANNEPLLCTKILTFILPLDPVNISHVLTLLAGGPGRGIRIARWVARSVLLGQTKVTGREYCHTPAIDDLSAILVQGETTSCPAFQITKDTDYVELCYYVHILATALTDISSYVPQELATIASFKTEQHTGQSPNKDKPQTPFQLLESRMTFLHRKITDHGTNIERSRTKAALHHLTMRLHFQLKAGTKSDKPSNIAHYFRKDS